MKRGRGAERTGTKGKKPKTSSSKRITTSLSPTILSVTLVHRLFSSLTVTLSEWMADRCGPMNLGDASFEELASKTKVQGTAAQILKHLQEWQIQRKIPEESRITVPSEPLGVLATISLIESFATSVDYDVADLKAANGKQSELERTMESLYDDLIGQFAAMCEEVAPVPTKAAGDNDEDEDEESAED